MEIKITESLGPIVTHPNCDISITGEIKTKIVIESKEELYLYIANIKKIAQEKSIDIGWERHNAFNPFYYKIFVKDSFGNSFIDNFSNSSTDLDGMFEVWQEIEKLMNKFIKRTKE